MAYCTIDDLNTLLSARTVMQLCDDDGDGEFIASPANSAQRAATQAIEEADAIIDSYLAGRYTVPLTVVPVLVRQMSAHLAAVGLFARRKETEIPEGIADRRKQALRMLADISDEKASLPGVDKRDGDPFQVSKTDADKLFTDDLLRRY